MMTRYILTGGAVQIIILFTDLNGLVHNDISHPHSSSGTITSSSSITVESTKFTEPFTVQKGGVQSIVGAVSICCLLCTIYHSWDRVCEGKQNNIFITFTRHQ